MNAGEYIDRAIARSYQNQSGILADAAPELLAELDLQFADYYQFAAGINPYVFCVRVAQPWSTDSWLIPADADTVVELERPGGAKVIVVPLEDRTAEATEACVFRVGRRYYPAGNSTDPPAGSSLVMYYTTIPPLFADLTTTVPIEWPTQFDSMVVNDLALHLASKDGRASEVDRGTARQQQWQARFAAWLQRPELNRRARFDVPRLVPTTAVQAFGAEKE
jgi:hypothetical protein